MKNPKCAFLAKKERETETLGVEKYSNLPIDSTGKSKFSCGNCFLLDFGLPWSVTILTISGKQETQI